MSGIWTVVCVATVYLLAATVSAESPYDTLWTGNACQGQTLVATCEPGYTIDVTDAFWGRENVERCAPPEGANANATNCRRHDILDTLTELCNGETSCDIPASTEDLGNPCPGIYKRLGVTYVCRATYLAESACQGRLLELACPDGEMIHVTNVTYAPADDISCNNLGDDARPRTSQTNCNGSAEAMDTVALICDGRADCQVSVVSDLLGEFCEGSSTMQLHASYVCAPCLNHHDVDEDCDEWNDNGECDANIGWMHANCRQSCWQCDLHSVDCDNVESDDDCTYWAGLGLCQTNSVYMYESCPNVCKMCASNRPDHTDWIPNEGEVYSGTVCQGRYIHAFCGEGKNFAIRMRSVFFGRAGADICPDDDQFTTETQNCTTEGTLSAARRVCDGREMCLLGAVTFAWGDACDGISKYLHAELTCQKCENILSDEVCKDKKSQGDCTDNREYMLDNCFAVCTGCEHAAAESCSNEHPSYEDCDDWGIRGECDVNTVWMRQKCMESCQVCLPEVQEECVDKDVNCVYWAWLGECDANPTFMNDSCRHACQLCGQQETGCVNPMGNDELCEEWAEEGACTENSSWMSVSCTRACFQCATAEAPEGCVNLATESACEYWMGTEECSLNAPYMNSYCTWSCRQCDLYPDECQNVKDDDQCNYWRGRGECETNPVWMSTNCARACALCFLNCNETTQQQCRTHCQNQTLIALPSSVCTTCDCVSPCDFSNCGNSEYCVVEDVPCSDDSTNCGPTARCYCDTTFVSECRRTCHSENKVMVDGDCISCTCQEACTDYECPSSQYCVAVNNETCGEQFCPLQPQCQGCEAAPKAECQRQCLADSNKVPVDGTECTGCDCQHVCDGFECPVHEFCTAQSVTCESEPCLPVAACTVCAVTTQAACAATCADRYLVPVPGTECLDCRCHDACNDVDCASVNKKCTTTETCGALGCVIEGLCVDRCINVEDDAECENRAALGECTSEPDLMRAQCSRACYMCSEIQPIDGCSNLISDLSCDFWSGTAECTNNPNYMHSNCEWACKQCSNYDPECSNDSPDLDCFKWAGHGECHLNPIWMASNCARACGRCSQVCDGATQQTCREHCGTMMLLARTNICDSCECYSPCEDHSCEDGEQCNVVNATCGDTGACGLTAMCECTVATALTCEETCESQGEVRNPASCMPCECQDVCQDHACEDSEYCDIVPVQCITAPCLPVPQCKVCTEPEIDTCAETCRQQNKEPIKGSECLGCECRSPCYNILPDDQCDYRESQYECIAFSMEMSEKCRHSCFLCGPTDAPDGCMNVEPTVKCDYWAATGECSNNPHWMQSNCQWSCRNCPQYTNACNNTLDDAECNKLKGKGMCLSDPDTMANDCARACNLCDITTPTVNPAPTCQPSCSSHGTCIDNNVCECTSGFTGATCADNSCADIANCSNHGTCIGPNECRCHDGYSGDNCSYIITTTDSTVTITTPSSSISSSSSTSTIKSSTTTLSSSSSTTTISTEKTTFSGKVELRFVFSSNMEWKAVYANEHASETAVLYEQLTLMLTSHYRTIFSGKQVGVQINSLRHNGDGGLIVDHTILFNEEMQDWQLQNYRCIAAERTLHTDNVQFTAEQSILSDCEWTKTYCLNDGLMHYHANGSLYCLCAENTVGVHCEERHLPLNITIIIIVLCCLIPALVLVVVCSLISLRKRNKKNKQLAEQEWFDMAGAYLVRPEVEHFSIPRYQKQ